MTMTILICRADYEALPEGAPFELCEGMLVKQPSPRYGHQRFQSLVLRELQGLVGPARAVPGPVDVLIDEINVFVPDIVVLSETPDDEAQYVGVPLLVVEVLSPSTQQRDRGHKTRRYLGLGVREVWLVDRLRERVEVATLEESRVHEGAERARSRALDGFSLVPDVLFG